MMNFHLRLLMCVVLMPLNLLAQSGIVKGKISNKINNEPIPFATVVVQGSAVGAVTDLNGNYQIDNLSPGLYNLQVSFVGYKPIIVFEND